MIKKIIFLVLLLMIFPALETAFALPPPDPNTPVPLFGEEIALIGALGYGVYKLFKKNKDKE